MMNGGLRYDLAKVAAWSVPLIVLVMVMDVVVLASSANTINFVHRVDSGALQADALTAAAELVDRYALVVGIAYLVVVICAFIANGIWIYRASWNAGQLQPFPGRITPGWAVGWFFVPIMLLWKPYQAMKETWAASVPATTLPGWLGWWWAAWVSGNILGQISLRMSKTITTYEDVRMVAMIDALSSVISLVAGFLFLKIVREVSRAQAGRRPESVFE